MPRVIRERWKMLSFLTVLVAIGLSIVATTWPGGHGRALADAQQLSWQQLSSDQQKSLRQEWQTVEGLMEKLGYSAEILTHLSLSSDQCDAIYTGSYAWYEQNKTALSILDQAIQAAQNTLGQLDRQVATGTADSSAQANLAAANASLLQSLKDRLTLLGGLKQVIEAQLSDDTKAVAKNCLNNTGLPEEYRTMTLTEQQRQQLREAVYCHHLRMAAAKTADEQQAANDREQQDIQQALTTGNRSLSMPNRATLATAQASGTQTVMATRSKLIPPPDTLVVSSARRVRGQQIEQE